jgi:hypothetical protein
MPQQLLPRVGQGKGIIGLGWPDGAVIFHRLWRLWVSQTLLYVTVTLLASAVSDVIFYHYASHSSQPSGFPTLCLTPMSLSSPVPLFLLHPEIILALHPEVLHI